MKTQSIEQNVLIANRVAGKGDTWVLVGETHEHVSLTDALEAWFTKTEIKSEFRLAPLDSKLYAIQIDTQEVQPEPIKKYNLYGDPQ